MSSLIDSIIQYVRNRKKRQLSQQSFKDEMKILVDACELSDEDSLKNKGKKLFGPILPTRNRRRSNFSNYTIIKSLKDLKLDLIYITENGVSVIRLSDEEVCVGDGNIIITVNQQNKEVFTFWKGRLSVETFSIAISNFLKVKIEDGIHFCDSEDRKNGCIVFDFRTLPCKKTFITPEDNVIVKRNDPLGPIEFNFGRNLYWYPLNKAKLLNPDLSGKYLGNEKPKGENEIIEIELGNLVDPLASPLKMSLNTTIENRRKSLPVTMIEYDDKNESLTTEDLKHVTDKNDEVNTFTSPTRTRQRTNTIGHSSEISDILSSFNSSDILTPPPIPKHLQPRSNLSTPPPPPIEFLSPKSAANKKKLKQLHWSKIPYNKINETIWGEKDSPIKVPIEDEIELETLFSLSPPKIKGDEQSQKRRTSILDLRRSNNVSILLKNFNIPISEIVKAIETLDDDKLSLENLLSLKQMFPLTEDEKKQFMSFKGDTSKLTLSEQFFIQSLHISNPEILINSMILRKQFHIYIENIENSMNLLKTCCLEIQQSKKFAKILKTILRLGCTLNRKSSCGFKLDILSKLVDTKSKDGKTSILDYLVQKLQRHEASLLNFDAELPSLSKSSSISMELLREELNEVRSGLNLIKSELTRCMRKVNQLEDKENQQNEMLSALKKKEEQIKAYEMNYMKSMKVFYERKSEVFKLTQQKYNETIKLYNDVLRYFGEENNSPESFFGNLNKFIDDFNKSKQKIEAMSGSCNSIKV